MGFIGDAVAVEKVGDDLWRTTRPVVYAEWPNVVLERCEVPAGYRTDFATIPRILWWLCPRYGQYTESTVLHDYLITHELAEHMISPREVDRLFREAMASQGVSVPRRWLMWAGVRWGAIFNRKRRRGSLDTLPGVLGISLLALPFLLPAVAVLPSLALFGVLERVCRG